MSRPESPLSPPVAIELAAIRKAFGPTVALSSASFTVAKGSAHALLGENGAGKSTLIKILSGLLQPDEGTIRIHGETVRLSDRRVAMKHGVETAFQELTLQKTLTVTQNLLLPFEPVSPFGAIRRSQSEERVAEALRHFRMPHISPRAELGRLSLAERQKLEIIRAAMRAPKVLLLDEPTSSLSGQDIDWLGEIIADRRDAGAAVLFISHRMPEVRLFCDSLTILRNGQSAGSWRSDSISDEEVITHIIGRSLEAQFPPRRPNGHAAAAPVAEIRTLGAGKARDISCILRPGEITGVAALQGMGQLDLFRALAGDIAVERGQIVMDGTPVTFHSPADAIHSAIGVSFVPEERKTEALFLTMDGTFNATLPILERFSRFGIPHRQIENRLIEAAFHQVQVAPRAAWSPMSDFSGGNQQKVVMAKWLLAESRLLLLYDPTRGVDIGTKAEIYTLLQDYAASGGAVLLYSTEVEEVIHLSDRLLVIYDGAIAAELTHETTGIHEAEVMRLALGGRALKPISESISHV